MIAPSRNPTDARPGETHTATDADGAHPAPAELLAELQRQVRRYLSAQRDLLGVRLRNIALTVIVLMLGLAAATTVVITSVVLLLVGISGATAHLLDLPTWGGQLAASLTILLGGGALAYALMLILRRSSLKRTVARYEHCQSPNPAAGSRVEPAVSGAAN